MSSVSVVIPTYNRPHYLTRVLDYYGRTEHAIVVSDGSDHSFRGAIPANAQYLHLPGTDVDSRIRSALKNVDSPYCVLCADDDFVVSEALRTCSQFLERSPGFAAAHGQYFAYPNDRLSGFQPIYHWGLGYSTRESAWERALEYFSSYVPTFYALHRSEALKSAFCENLPLRTAPYANVLEIYQSAMTVLAGRIARIPVFYSLREQARGTASGRYVSIRDFWTREEHRETREWFCKALNSGFVATAAGPSDQGRSFAAHAVIEPYLEHFLPTYERRSTLSGRVRLFLQSLLRQPSARSLSRRPEFSQLVEVIEKHPLAR